MQTDDGFDTELTANPMNPGGNVVTFGWHPIQNAQKSELEGRPIYEDKEMIQVFTPGDRTNIIHREVADMDRRMYAAQYKAFKEDRDQDAAVGTLLKAVSWMTRSQVEEAKYFKIRTIEQLGNVSDEILQRLGPGWQELRQKAMDALAQAKDASHLTKMRAELAQRDSQIEALRHQVEELAGLVKQEPKPRPSKGT